MFFVLFSNVGYFGMIIMLYETLSKNYSLTNIAFNVAFVLLFLIPCSIPLSMVKSDFLIQCKLKQRFTTAHLCRYNISLVSAVPL